MWYGYVGWLLQKSQYCKSDFWIIIVIIIFCFGVQYGQMRSGYKFGHPYYNMMRGYGDDFDRVKMMKDYNKNVTPETGTTAPLTP